MSSLNEKIKKVVCVKVKYFFYKTIDGPPLKGVQIKNQAIPPKTGDEIILKRKRVPYTFVVFEVTNHIIEYGQTKQSIFKVKCIRKDLWLKLAENNIRSHHVESENKRSELN